MEFFGQACKGEGCIISQIPDGFISHKSLIKIGLCKMGAWDHVVDMYTTLYNQ